MKSISKTGIIALALLPLTSYAQTYDISTIEGIVVAVSGILETILPALVAIAVFMVVWFTFMLVVNAGDPEKRKSALHGIFWGIIGIFLMYSIWGIIRVFTNTVGFEDTTPVTTPNFIQSQ